MNQEALEQVMKAQELVREANRIFLSLMKDENIERKYHDMIVKAEIATFDLLTGNLNKIEHDVKHELAS